MANYPSSSSRYPFPPHNGIPPLDSLPGSGQAWLENLMNRKYRITITDGRQFHGDLQCTDNVSHDSLTPNLLPSFRIAQVVVLSRQCHH
jgi:hypothetical protein